MSQFSDDEEEEINDDFVDRLLRLAATGGLHLLISTTSTTLSTILFNNIDLRMQTSFLTLA